MNDERWENTVGKIKDSFEVIEHRTENLDPDPGTVEFIIFNGPLGKMKLERTTRPLVLDKRAIGSKRMGSQATVQYVYSDTEKTHTFKALRWDAGQNDWVEMGTGESFKL
ncbi:MAG: hypothetical protein WCT27_02970 [Patescibacteria group bacterium]|jgi:hypothetical protein